MAAIIRVNEHFNQISNNLNLISLLDNIYIFPKVVPIYFSDKWEPDFTLDPGGGGERLKLKLYSHARKW